MAKYKFRTKPYRHQVEALKVLLRNSGGALFMEMGTGKTKVGIDWAAAEALRIDPRAPKMHGLVTCPLSAVGVWWKEIAKHDPFADNDFMGVEWKVVHYDIVWRPHVYDALVEWLCEVPPEQRLIIADESHKIKTPGARRSKGMHRLAKYAGKRAIMSGTPVTNKGPLDLFSQFKFVDESIFGSRFETFKRRVAIFQWNSPIILRFKNERWVRKKTEHLTFRIKKDECLDLPPRTHEIVPVMLEPKARRVYDELANQAITEFEGVEVEAPHVLARMMRLQQITGGWLKNQDKYKRISTAKLTILSDLLANLKENQRCKVVVFCRFRKELFDIRQAAIKVGYRALTVHGGNRDRRERIFDCFEKSEEYVVLICMLDTGAESRNELVVASEAIFYSHDFSFVHFMQALDRLHRPGQEHKVTYYHLLVEFSIDPTILHSLHENIDLAELVLNYPTLLHSSSDTAKVKERQ